MRAHIALLALIVIGCVSPTGTSNTPVTATMVVGQEVVVAPDAISFRLDSIVSDSRCPFEVECVQAGSVTLRFAVASPAHPGATMLLIDSARPDSSTGVIVQVSTIAPVRHQGVTIAQADYRIGVVFRRP